MASMGDFPVQDVVDWLIVMNSRTKMQDGSRSEVDIFLSIRDARMFYAAMKWLDVLDTQGVGYENTSIKLRDCRDFLRIVVDALKAQPGEEKMFTLDPLGARVLETVERHLDHLSIIKEADEQQKKRGKRRS